MKIVLNIATVIIGALLGLLYYKFVGCRSGACPITSNIWSSIIFGAVFGYLLLSPMIPKIMKIIKK
ncbi:MAG: DUF6132 family protein [Candidatus Cloacimonetes bacterium]|nr:DUF6132 family protein [Candidatus Cloacimonadota bacterium]